MATHKPNIRSGYIYNGLNPQSLKRLVAAAAKLLRGRSFEAFAFRGMSGALVAPILAYSLKKTLIMVRKPGEDAHSTFRVEGDINAENYIIVDDFMCSGTTVRTILKEVEIFAPEAKCIGILMYRDFLSYNDPLTLIDPKSDRRISYQPHPTTLVEVVREIPF